MNDDKLLDQIGELIDKKLAPTKKQLDTIELKVEAVHSKVDQAQQETIETLTGLIHAGYEIHEKRIKKLEDEIISPS